MFAVIKPAPRPGIEFADRPEPKLVNRDDVLVEVAASGICGSDTARFEWKKPDPRFAFPRILGHEGAGTVVEVGSDVTGFKPGDRVAMDSAGACGKCYHCRRGITSLCAHRHETSLGSARDGTFARLCVTQCNGIFKIPDHISFDQAIVIEPLAVAMRAMERSHMKPGDYVVILGPGPIGTLGVMVAQVNGASKVVLTGLDIDKERLQFAARDLKVDTVNVSTQNLQKKVMEETDGIGADVVFDFAGGAKALTQAMEVVRGGGEIIMTGSWSAGEVDMQRVIGRELTIIGQQGRVPSTWQRAIALVASGQIDPSRIISHRLPLSKTDEAFDLFFKRVARKIVLIPDK